MIFKKKPVDFNLAFRVVGCFVECNGKILFLLRREDKPEGGTWGVPAGKILQKESMEDAMARELLEETGLNVKKEDLTFFEKSYVRFPHYDFIYHMFHLNIDSRKKVKINKEEHSDFVWVIPKESLKLNLIQDQNIGIRSFYGI